MRYKISVKIKNDLLKSSPQIFFHLKSKANLVILWKCNSHLQYYKIDSSFSIKLQEINLHVCDEYMIEREAPNLIRTEREV